MSSSLVRMLGFCVAFVVLGSLLIVAAIVGATSASACAPTPSAVISGDIVVGGGSTSTQYFAQFGTQIVAKKKATAALIIQIGRSESFSDYSIEIAIGTALQESGLMNLPGGDRDSLGIFQQRPSVGSWGTASEILDPTHAIEAFYKVLKTIPNRDQLPMVASALKVQNPGVKIDGTSAYQKSWHWDALSKEIVEGTSAVVCSVSTEAHLPLDPGYHVSARFDDTDPGYAGIKPHSGTDLSDYKGGTLGRPVYAALAGVVVASGIGNSCSTNNAVLIRHPDGVETEYMHMKGSDITVRVGDTVAAGQQIGKIGSCGQSTGAHLHFAVELAAGKEPWLSSLNRVPQFGQIWLDPVGYLAHYGVTLVPSN